LKRHIFALRITAFILLGLACTAGPTLAVTQNTTIVITVNKKASANLTLSGTAFTWANVQDNTNQFLASDGSNITVTGTLITTIGTGSGSVAIASPANITGTGGSTLPINALSITCSGTARTGQTFATAQTALTASSNTNCATYAANYNTAINFTLGMFLDDRSISADTYPATNFTVVATAT